MSCHKLTMLLYVSYGYICGRLFHTIARLRQAEEEAALEPHGLGFKAGAACSYDSLWRHLAAAQAATVYVQEKEAVKAFSEHWFKRYKFGWRICTVGENYNTCIFHLYREAHVTNFTKFPAKILNSLIVLIEVFYFFKWKFTGLISI